MADILFKADDYIFASLRKDPSYDEESALTEIYKRMRPGDPVNLNNARLLIKRLFFDPRRYDLGAVGRYKLNARLGLDIPADYALIDGNRMPPLAINGETIIKGDANSPSIAAASILAKVSRDRFMLELDEKMPQYQFAKHKGYGTKLHYEMLDRYGPSPIHRLTFLAKWEAKRRG